MNNKLGDCDKQPFLIYITLLLPLIANISCLKYRTYRTVHTEQVQKPFGVHVIIHVLGNEKLFKSVFVLLLDCMIYTFKTKDMKAKFYEQLDNPLHQRKGNN